MIDIRKKPGVALGLTTIGVFGTIMFFRNVNLTQSQAVVSLFILLGILSSIWFLWWKPWK